MKLELMTSIRKSYDDGDNPFISQCLKFENSDTSDTITDVVAWVSSIGDLDNMNFVVEALIYMDEDNNKIPFMTISESDQREIKSQIINSIKL